MKKHFFFLCAALVCAGCLAALEVESGKLDPAMAETVSKPEASGGAAVRLFAPRGTKVPVADIKNLPGPAVKLEISVDKPGMYAVRLRAFTFNDGSNSAWCTVDGGKAIPFWFRTADVGKWAEQPAAETVQLTPGKHELAFYVRENNIQLDKVEVVFKGALPRRTDADPSRRSASAVPAAGKYPRLPADAGYRPIAADAAGRTVVLADPPGLRGTATVAAAAGTDAQ